MAEERLRYLFEKCLKQEATSAELSELHELIGFEDRKEQVEALFSSALLGNGIPEESGLDEEKREAIISSIFQATRSIPAAAPASKRTPRDPAVPLHRPAVPLRWLAAAAVILLLGIGAYVWTVSKKPAQPGSVTYKAPDVAPGSDGAILTLTDGSQIALDSLGNGVVADQNGAKAIIKDGRLTYDISGAAPGHTAYNIMTTPKKRQFSLFLPDGTRVWLNAASSIRYPVIFEGKERRVEVSGEAYFEVAENREMPFRIDMPGKAEVEVLGTHFNINAYENDAHIRTTLLEGSILVRQESRSLLMKPGQQVQMPVQPEGGQEQMKLLTNVDIEKVMAWKNGAINFDGLTLEEAMHQIERWYDIEVVYEKGIPDIRLWGELGRNVSLGSLLKGLEGSKLHFRIEEDGRRLVIMP